MSSVAPKSASTQDPLQRALWLTATVGSFNPRDLLASLELQASERRTLLARLATLCAEVKTGEQVLWTLNADARRRALDEMQTAGVLAADRLPQLTAQLALQPLDHFGQHLRAALHGAPDIDLPEQGDVDAQYAAFEFVGRGGVGVAPERAGESAGIVEQRAQRVAVEEQLAQTIGPVFVGRDKEVEALRNFAKTGELPSGELVASTSAGTDGVPLVFINGIGGAGKSALLATLVHDLRQNDSGVAATIVLDFDRPTLASLDGVELTFEVMRQIALSQPHIAKVLVELRRTALDEFTTAELASSNVLEAYRHNARAMYSIHQRLRPHLERTSLRGAPLLIILDSFEEVVTLGEHYVATVYRWLEELRKQAGLSRLRVIVSGRATPADLQPEAEPRRGEVALGDLLDSDARDALQRRGVAAESAGKLVGMFGSNPLVLRLLGDYAHQNGPEAVQALLSDPEHRERYQAATSQRILYSRILDRIRGDAAVRALASPGLVVRIVTPGVIRHVLAEPCGLGPITHERADELFEELARQVWLVRSVGARAVAHRRDVRSMMLPFAKYPGRRKGDAQLVAAVNDIHVRAVRFHTAPPADVTVELSEDTRRGEALYHQLFVDGSLDALLSGPDLDTFLPVFLASVAADLDDFPLAVRAGLKQLLGKSLLQEEVEALSVPKQQAYRDRLEDQHGRVVGPGPGVGGAAQPTTEAGPSTPPRPPREISNAKLVAAFAAGEFDEVAEQCPRALARMLSQLTRGGSERARDMVEDVTWLTALATLARPPNERSKHQSVWAADLCEQVLLHWDKLSARHLMDKSGLTIAHYLAAVAILLDGDAATKEVAELAVALDQLCIKRHRRPRITSTAALRIFQLFMTVLGEPRGILPMSVATSCLQYFAALLKRGGHVDDSIGVAELAWSNQYPQWKQELVTSLTDLEAVETVRLQNKERQWADAQLDLLGWWSHPEYAELARRWPILRGMSTELQTPCLVGLRERFRRRTEGGEILKRLRNISSVWPADLTIHAIGPERSINDGQLSTIGHLADRFGALSLLFIDAPPDSVGARVEAIRARYHQLFMSATKHSRDAQPAGSAPRSKRPK